ncbi:MAG: tRNA (adenosine(37)-N6)-threonylcarbamoyltransferase complex ATPase subunit type 1 TsaE [Bacteroidota bacterium]|jgi:tRNA threonylcarbamoyladenosine biosynthesis protein TsaE
MYKLKLSYQLPEISEIAKKILGLNKKVVLFYGEMGSGKTTLIKELCQQLGSKSQFSSPTFQIVNEYVYDGGLIFHFDLYRLNATSELIDLGFDDYLFSGNYCFIEWPQKSEELVTHDFIQINLTNKGDARLAEVKVH